MPTSEIRLPRTEVVRDRHAYVVERCRGRAVLHIGCADAGYLDERLASGQHLHVRLVEAASRVCGVDIDREALAALAERGIGDLVEADVCTEGWIAALPHGAVFDVIVLSEVLEHLPAPGTLVKGLTAAARDWNAEVVITAPNAFRVKSILGLLRNTEVVHPDHVCWYSYATLRRLVESCGFRVDAVHAYSFEETRLVPYRSWESLKSTVPRLPRRLLVRWLQRRSSFLADGIIMVARPC